jgi:hypothetical protein
MLKIITEGDGTIHNPPKAEYPGSGGVCIPEYDEAQDGTIVADGLSVCSDCGDVYETNGEKLDYWAAAGNLLSRLDYGCSGPCSKQMRTSLCLPVCICESLCICLSKVSWCVMQAQWPLFWLAQGSLMPVAVVS